MYFQKCTENPDEVTSKFSRGFWEGIWWAFVTASTAGWVWSDKWENWVMNYVITFYVEKVRVLGYFGMLEQIWVFHDKSDQYEDLDLDEEKWYCFQLRREVLDLLRRQRKMSSTLSSFKKKKWVRRARGSHGGLWDSLLRSEIYKIAKKWAKVLSDSSEIAENLADRRDYNLIQTV